MNFYLAMGAMLIIMGVFFVMWKYRKEILQPNRDSE